MTARTTSAPSSLRFAGALLLLLAASCSGGTNNPTDIHRPDDIGGVDDAALLRADSGPDSDAGVEDATPPLDVQEQSDAAEPDFEFGFEPVPFITPFDYLTPIHLTWDGAQLVGTLVYLGSDHASVAFQHDGQQLTFRGAGVIDMDGEVRLQLSAMLCLNGDVDCAPENTAIADRIAFEVVGRHDGEEVVFAPWKAVLDVDDFGDADFRVPLDARLTPSNGFKPSHVPDLDGNFTGTITYVRPGSVLTGTQACALNLNGAALQQADRVDGRLMMRCGDKTYLVDEDPGPVSTSIRADSTQSLAFEFRDGDQHLTFALSAVGREIVGVIADETPTARSASDIDPTAWWGVVLLAEDL